MWYFYTAIILTVSVYYIRYIYTVYIQYIYCSLWITHPKYYGYYKTNFNINMLGVVASKRLVCLQHRVPRLLSCHFRGREARATKLSHRPAAGLLAALHWDVCRARYSNIPMAAAHAVAFPWLLRVPLSRLSVDSWSYVTYVRGKR